MNAATLEAGNKRLQIVLTILGCSGIVLLFLPFSGGMGVADGWEYLGRIMLPVTVLPFLIVAGYVARIGVGRIPPWANPVGYAVTILLAAVAVSAWDSYGEDFTFVALLFFVPVLCLLPGIRFGTGKQSDTRGLVALQGLYAVHLSFFLAAFLDGAVDAGYWVAALALMVTFVQITLHLERKVWAACLFAPSVAVWTVILLEL